jgi:hypothetical protein
LRSNNLLKHVIEGKIEGRIEMTGRRGSYWMTLREIENAWERMH